MAPFLFLQNFETYLRTEKRFSEHTISAYLKDVSEFIVFAQLIKQDDFREVSYLSIRSWLVNLVSLGLTNKSVNRKLSSLRSYLKYCRMKGLIEEDPMLKVKGPKVEKRLPQFAKENELTQERLNIHFDDNFYGRRDRLIFELFYQTGIRLSELIGLESKDIHNGQIKVIGKRKKERIIPINKDLEQDILKYIIERDKLGFSDDYLLVTDKGDKLYPKFVYRKINSYLGKVTNLEQCSPHVLRHTFATHMLNNGAGLETLRVLLGHANLSATQVYTHNSFAQLTNIYSLAHPRGHKSD